MPACLAAGAPQHVSAVFEQLGGRDKVCAGANGRASGNFLSKQQGKDWKLRATCEKKCKDDAACQGYEHNTYDYSYFRQGYCNTWKAKITKVNGASKFSCWVKKQANLGKCEDRPECTSESTDCCSQHTYTQHPHVHACPFRCACTLLGVRFATPSGAAARCTGRR